MLTAHRYALRYNTVLTVVLFHFMFRCMSHSYTNLATELIYILEIDNKNDPHRQMIDNMHKSKNLPANN